jgi:iron complex transport system substrate-binding protein
MKKLALALLGLVATVTSASPRATAAITVVDDSRTKVVLPHSPRRIVSVTPATTEILFAIGAGPRVVGGTTSDDYPPAARRIARIGDWTPNYEKVLSVHPDLIVVDDIAEHDAVARLRSLRQNVLVIHPSTLPAVENDIKLIGRATGCVRGANAVVAAMEKKIRTAAAIAASDHNRPRVLAVAGHDPLFVAGSDTFIDDGIRRAGGINTVADVHGYAQYSNEAIVARPPDVILAGPDDARALERSPAFRAVAAVRARRFISIDPALLERPGPRLADGILQLAQALHPRH